MVPVPCPVHNQLVGVPLVAVAVKVAAADPAHIDSLFTVTVGNAFTVNTPVESALWQPLPSVTTTL